MSAKATFSQNYDLVSLNTLAIHSIAKLYVKANSQEDLVAACHFANQQNLRLIPLGGGSNVVLNEYIDALVVEVANKGIKIVSETDTHALIEAEAGENWHSFVSWCLHNGFHGLENLALIPGTVGAAPIQNIGAYGVELADCFESLEAIEISSGTSRIFKKNECAFGYRESVFKQNAFGKYCISNVVFKLQKSASVQTTYSALLSHLEHHNLSETPENIFNGVVSIRRSKLPDPNETPNAGSFFKNPVINDKHLKELQQEFPGIVSYPVSGGQFKIAAGWLIENAGWKNKGNSKVKVYDKQALVITNPERLASGADIKAFAEAITEDIRRQYNIELEIEPRFVQ